MDYEYDDYDEYDVEDEEDLEAHFVMDLKNDLEVQNYRSKRFKSGLIFLVIFIVIILIFLKV